MARELTKKELNKQQKARAQRVDHFYYSKPHPWRTRMWLLSVGLPILALLGLGALSFIPTGANIYMPGPVSTKHQIFAERCDECHETLKDAQGKLTFGAVTDAKCTNCHDGPIHQANQVYPWHKTPVEVKGKTIEYEAPGCETCHAEHAVNVRLTELADRHCTQCHLDLKVKEGSLTFATGIKSFTDGHPEFKPKKAETKDMAQVKFNHAKHIGPGASPKKADGTALGCTDCHRPDKQRAYMQPINFESHCRSCHDIAIPPIANIGDVKLPHEQPALIAAVVKTAFSEYVLKNGGKLPAKKDKNPKWTPPKPGRPSKEPEFVETPDTRPPGEWIKQNVDLTLKPMFFPEKGKEGGACNLCHIPEAVQAARTDELKKTVPELKVITGGYNWNGEARDVYDAEGLPLLAKTDIPTVWFKEARFNHETHRVAQCTSCHTQAFTSKDTADVLLPGIENCRTCHNSTGARSGCNECHLYHDKKNPKVEGMLTIEELRMGTSCKAPAASPDGATKKDATEAPKDAAKETPKDAPKDAAKDAPKEPAKP